MANTIIFSANGAPIDTDVIGWRVWYADGSTKDSRTSAWSALTAVGAVVVMLYYARMSGADVLRRVMEGSAFYFAYTNTVINAVVFDQADVNPTTLPQIAPTLIKTLLADVTLTDAQTQAIVVQAFAAVTAP
jgi:hypothetical protein